MDKIVDCSVFDKCSIVFGVPALESKNRCLCITNYASGAEWMTYPEMPVEILGESAGVRLADMGNGWFALVNKDEGISKILSVDDKNGTIRANADCVSEKELFRLIVKDSDDGKNRFYLYSKTGKYVSIESGLDSFGERFYRAVAKDYYPHEKWKLSLYSLFDPWGQCIRF